MSATRTHDANARGLRAWTPAIAATATLGLGYLDLFRGGTSISAVLLVVGYVVMVPWAIMATRPQETASR